MNVLSLFDGISCGKLALQRANIDVDNYYASEIDLYAIAISKYNHKDIVHLGDVTKWQEWELPKIDLLLAGSPCQGFSNAGIGLNFNDPRSKLFFTFLEILSKLQPTYFLLENVKMRKEWVDIITQLVGVKPILINSALVSAQNRERYYWTNIPVSQPEDKGILLKDILLNDADEPMLSNIYGGWKEKQPRTHWNKSVTIRTASGGGHIPSLIISDKAKQYMDRTVKDGRTHWDFKHHSDVTQDKSSCVTANHHKKLPYAVLKDKNCIRYVDPIECERLQTLPDGYTIYGVGKIKISNTQRYKCIGNGWTVDVIAHILKGVNNE